VVLLFHLIFIIFGGSETPVCDAGSVGATAVARIVTSITKKINKTYFQQESRTVEYVCEKIEHRS
jgi:hypothetical protein